MTAMLADVLFGLLFAKLKYKVLFMSTYKCFSDIQKIDLELASYFKQPGDAVRWCMAIEGPVAKWVEAHNTRGEGGKGLWEVVCFASAQKGVFDMSLPRNKRAAMLVKFCPDAFRKPGKEMAFCPSKEISALQTSMEHYKHNSQLKLFDKLCDSNKLRTYISEIKSLFDGQELPPPPQEEVPTIEESVEAYLRNSFNDGETAFPRFRLHIKKDYGDGIVPDLALAMYQHQNFLDNDKPSCVWAYEFLYYPLTTDKLYAFIGKYAKHRGLLKPYIVSPYSFDGDLISIAEDNAVGLILVNQHTPMTKDSYIVQRSIEDYAQWQYDMAVLKGQLDMSTTLMIYDSEYSFLTSSLSDWLVSKHIWVKPGTFIKAPFLTNEFIERKADELTRSQVEAQKKRLAMLSSDVNKRIIGQHCINLFSLEISPYDIAKELGISYLYTTLHSNEQLGFLDVNTGTIYLQPLNNNFQRDRFTIAHELGHHQLHLSLFRQHNYKSVGESNTTINGNASIIKGEQKWLEHHANYFAACLLMPQELVKELYTMVHYLYIQQRYGDKFGPLYYNPEQVETHDSYSSVVVRMAHIMNVSIQAMHYRLIKMGLLICPISR